MFSPFSYFPSVLHRAAQVGRVDLVEKLLQVIFTIPVTTPPLVDSLNNYRKVGKNDRDTQNNIVECEDDRIVL